MPLSRGKEFGVRESREVERSRQVSQDLKETYELSGLSRNKFDTQANGDTLKSCKHFYSLLIAIDMFHLHNTVTYIVKYFSVAPLENSSLNCKISDHS